MVSKRNSGKRTNNSKTIAVVGLGQVGGSLVLAIRKKKLPFRIIGIETSRRRLRLMSDKLDEASSRWEKTQQADLVFVCLHYKEAIRFLKQAPKNQLLIDVCSGKKKIVTLAKRMELRFIGGHPLCGNERAGEQSWNQNMFQDAPFFLCPSRKALPLDRTLLTGFIRNLGAKPVFVNAALHDDYLARTSHFPAILSKMLSRTTKKVPALFRGPGYKSMTRLSKTSPELSRTFLESNQASILKAARQLRAELDRWIKNHRE
jgi:prephenate dehydrogenase